MVNAADALERLKQGNARFASGSSDLDPLTSYRKRGEVVDGQQPFAVILGCSDSRVPVEMVFDQDLGDLFVVRVAGNVVAAPQIGSVEFAIEKFGTNLVVVLGHSRCGAVRATIEQLQGQSANGSLHHKEIADCIKPAVEKIVSENSGDDAETLVEKSVRANILHAADSLQHSSAIIEDRLRSGSLRVVAAEYSLDTGVVEFFER